jgi:hypothetical protein
MRLSVAVCLLAFAAWALPSAAQWREWDTDFDEDKKSWKEIEAQIPAYPRPENLVRVQTGAATSHEFYVDANSVSVGEDGVVRYTVVVKTGGGATNVTFEGMRCRTRERKLYAIGHADHTWVRAREPQWQRFTLRDLTPHHHTLYHDYFCSAPTRPTPPRRAIDALKRGTSLARSTATD